jgi:hypothetical protein
MPARLGWVFPPPFGLRDWNPQDQPTRQVEAPNRGENGPVLFSNYKLILSGCRIKARITT